MKEQLKELREKIGEHDVQLNQIYDAMENLLDETAAQRKWEDRDRIGFKKQKALKFIGRLKNNCFDSANKGQLQMADQTIWINVFKK